MKDLAVWLLSIAAAVSLFGPASPATRAGQEPVSRKTVLALFATGRDAEGSVTFDRTLRQGLSKGLDGALDYYSEHFDTGRFPDSRQNDVLAEFLRQKYRGRDFDLLVTIGGGLEFLAQHRGDLFPGSPVVSWSLISPPSVTIPNSTGLIADVDFGASLELVTKLQPDVTQVFVVSGATPSDRLSAERARDQFRRFEARFTFTYLSGLATSELERRLSALPPASIVYYVVVNTDGEGVTFYPLEYLDRIAAVANRPIYSWIDSTIDHGALGGRMVPIKSHADTIADLALRVLRGERAESIPVSKAVNLDVVDWRQLQRWRISEARVPAGIDLRHRQPGVWGQYRAYIAGAVVFMLAQAALIAGLLIQRRARQRAEVSSRRNLALAADANRRVTMTTLTGSIAHELGQPLNGILHNAQAGEMLLASQRATPEKLREILADIRTADLRAAQIIERHRTMLRSHQLDTKPIDIHAVVRDSVALIADSARSKQIQVDVELPPDPCFVVGDPVLLQQVVVNLVMNAMDAMTETPQERRRITVQNKVSSANAEVSVQDVGTGLPASVDGKLFEPFVTTKANGMGIGLTIAHSIIEAHRGRIAACNNPEGGATFTISLPCAEAPAIS